jgi:hypothetical protein
MVTANPESPRNTAKWTINVYGVDRGLLRLLVQPEYAEGPETDS